MLIGSVLIVKSCEFLFIYVRIDIGIDRIYNIYGYNACLV